MEWPTYLDEYEKLVIRMNTPRVVIDNAVCPTATVVQVDSARKRGVLLEAVQVLTDLNLSIKKAYISSSTEFEGLTALELTGTDRPGLLSEVFAVLAELQCSVSEAKAWTHNGRIACLVFVKDAVSGSGFPIEEEM